MISLKLARQLLSYDPQSGRLSWRLTRGRAKAGSTAGTVTTINGRAYRQVCIKGEKCYAPQLAVLLMTGKWPDGIVTFRDGVSLNIAWSNLTVSSHADIHHGLVRPRGPQKNNSTGFLGVSRTKSGAIYARFRRGEIRVWVPGSFDTLEAAAAARAAAMKRWDAQHRPTSDGNPG